MMKLSVVSFLGILSLIKGVPVNDSSWRVVGGIDAETEDNPSQIILQYLSSFTCSGSIISDRYVVTAAHCVDGRSPASLTVVAGTNFLNSGGVKYAVAQTQVHEDYNPYYIYNDVALIKLAETIVFTDYIQPIELEQEDVAGDLEAILFGWGRTNYPGDVSEIRQKLNLRTLSFEDCKARWSGGNPVYDSEICTLTKAGEGACHGDSGGPLIRNKKLIGVVSWGSPCARGMPDVFSRVSSFAPWIIDHMK